MEELTFHRLLLRVREQKPEQTLFVSDDLEYSAAAHIDSTLRLLSSLTSMGAKPGDRVGILAGPSALFMNVLHATALGRIIGVPLNIRLNTVELAAALRDSSPSVLAVDSEHLALARGAWEIAGIDTQVILLTPADSEQPLLTVEELIAAGDATVPDEPREDDGLLMLFTGGTTGRSKGLVATNRQLVLSLHRAEFQFQISTPGSTQMSVNPLFHIGAISACWAFPAFGGNVVLRPSFDPSQVLDDAKAYNITHLPAVVSILQRILEHPRFSPDHFPALRYITYGASPISPDLLRQVRGAFRNVKLEQSYGMTELFGSATQLSTEDHLRGDKWLKSVGRALPGVRIACRDSEGAEVPRGTVGEVCVEAASVVLRPWTEAGTPVDGEPFLRTGDLGRMDDEGYLFLMDRAKDMIKTGGENVYSIEVEEVLLQHPDIHDVAVVGLPDPIWGERVHAEVVPAPGKNATLEADDVIAFAREHLSRYKVPKTITILTEPLPRSAIGKLLKRVVREEAQQRYDQEAVAQNLS